MRSFLYTLAVLLVATTLASAFLPSPAGQAVRAAPLRAYVPDGLTPAQWAKQKRQEAAKNKKSKQKYAKVKCEDLDQWIKKRDAKFPNKPGAGHTFAKVKDLPKLDPRSKAK
uniref:PSI-F n=1 Tax=Rhizochromulina marina TaxID=1034831 RepID=A0A7S2SPR0_9STRA|mmetsp:Transcript_33303/g.96507  ORF Transcript_33303/g.96507 Transcript_33303/m.96507 type:complete len:112 (+) Transcript_33303:63-398(+)|eukprot:CAMPEP_0118971126 /NCGR_PEP_ID=MMETSP1173-20130426/7846_1 /TAXON_ID=1034831 /ORGANISM="Rhizochromulina marina cf, Strain CCMP1243" /LENGTH=111 /DNA_ID=CAMNT_0006920559 /DNA_START=76 /DNA_END=411 /DNA_ORIENTATION=+